MAESIKWPNGFLKGLEDALAKERGETKMTAATKPTCELCGEPMPEGEEMFKVHGYSGGCPKPSLTKSVPIMNDRHPSHVTRISDASSFDEVCINCGATDITGGGWGALANPCPKASITQQTMTDAEKLREIANDIQKHVGDTTLKSLMTFHLLRIVDLLDSVPPEILSALGAARKSESFGSVISLLISLAFERTETLNREADHRFYLRCACCGETDEQRERYKPDQMMVKHKETCALNDHLPFLRLLAAAPEKPDVK